MKTLTLLFVAVGLWAQPTLKVLAPAVVTPGATITATVQLTGTTSNVVAIEDTVVMSPVFPASVFADPSVTSKTLVCAVLDSSTCILWGVRPAAVVVNGNTMIASDAVFSDLPIPDGSTIQQIVFTVPTTLANGSIIRVMAANAYAVDAAGAPVTIAGSGATITVTTPVSQVQTALDAWNANRTQANFLALLTAQIAAQKALGQ